MRPTRLVVPWLHAGQREVLAHPARHKVLRAGRRWRKTTLGVVWLLQGAVAGERTWYVAPTYPISGIAWRMIQFLYRQVPGHSERLSERRVTFPSGGFLEVNSGHDPDSLIGEGLDRVVLDEGAYVPERAWREKLRPALMDRQGSSLHLSTPAGLNWWHQLWQEAEEREGWATWHYPTSSNPAITAEELADARLDMTELAYLQEIEAEFVEAGSGRYPPEWFRYFRTLTVHEGGQGRQVYVVDGRKIMAEDCIRFATVDPAVSEKTSADYTAVACCALTPDHHLLVLEMWRGRVQGPDVVPTVRRLMEKWNLRVAHFERTAYQLILVQQARREGLAARELAADRDKLARSAVLEARMSSGQVWFLASQPWLADLERELLAFPAGEHDDQVDALAYAATQIGVRRQVEMKLL